MDSVVATMLVLVGFVSGFAVGFFGIGIRADATYTAHIKANERDRMTDALIALGEKVDRLDTDLRGDVE